MGLIEATKSCFSKYATFSGRAQRSEFWWFTLFLFVATIILGVVDAALFPAPMNEVGVLGLIFSLATLLPSLAVSARRLHDIDRTGWWLLLMFIPLIGWLVLIYWDVIKGTAGANRFGPDPLATET